MTSESYLIFNFNKMPKPTFWNLSEEKREHIINIAIEEFGKHGYQKSSVENIANNSGISKGSVYQYFDNKNELYNYIFEFIAEQKLKYIRINYKRKKDFFESYMQIFKLGFKFGIDNPQYTLFFEKYLQNVDQKSIDQKVMDNIQKLEMFHFEIIKDAYAEGEFDEYYSMNFLLHILNTVSLSFKDYIFRKYKIDHTSMIKDGKLVIPISEEELEKQFEKFIYFLKNGISRK